MRDVELRRSFEIRILIPSELLLVIAQSLDPLVQQISPAAKSRYCEKAC